VFLFFVDQSRISPSTFIDPSRTWSPIGRPRCILRTLVVHILNSTITGAVSTQHMVYTLIGTDSAHRGMNILCRLSIGLPTWHNALLYTRARDNASWILCAYLPMYLCMHMCTRDRETVHHTYHTHTRVIHTSHVVHTRANCFPVCAFLPQND